MPADANSSMALASVSGFGERGREKLEVSSARASTGSTRPVPGSRVRTAYVSIQAWPHNDRARSALHRVTAACASWLRSTSGRATLASTVTSLAPAGIDQGEDFFVSDGSVAYCHQVAVLLYQAGRATLGNHCQPCPVARDVHGGTRREAQGVSQRFRHDYSASGVDGRFHAISLPSTYHRMTI